MNKPHVARRSVFALGLAAALLALSGCATLNQYNSEVSSFGSWPAGRAAGTYAFDRLPSQQSRPEEQKELEAAAAEGLRAAGFSPVAEGGTPDVLVQLGARVSQQASSPWDDPSWWRFNAGRWNWPRWGGPGWAWSMRVDRSEYERETALLLRDRASGQPLFEARARSTGLTPGSSKVITAMFMASLQDFPNARPEPHAAAVTLP